MDSLTQMRLDFNRHLLDAIGGQVLDTSIFGWDAGFTKWLLALCMAIAFFQSVLRDEKSMLVEWTKIVIAAWFCLAILGGVNYKNVPVFSRLDNVPQEYKVKSSRPTLERAVFNYMAWRFDQLGQAVMGNSDLGKEVTQLNTIQDRLQYAILYCDTNNADCLRKFLTGEKDPATVLKEQQKKNAGAEGNESGWFSSLVPGADTMKAFFGMMLEFFHKMSNPAYWLFPLLIWILDLFRAFINFFVLLTFGITAALSLFMIKVLCVFMVIPSYRGRVIDMFKHTLSAAMYGFAMNLILWLSVVITKGLNEATAGIIVKRLTSPTGVGAFAAEMGVLMMANFLTTFVIMAMQIVAMARVPKFTQNLMNLSLQEIVNIGETLVSAGMGMAKVAAGMAAGVGGLALGGAGAFALSSLTGKSAGALGSSAGNMFKNMMGGGGGGPSDVGGAGMGAGPNRGGPGGPSSGGGATDAFFTGNPSFMGNPNRGGGGDLDKVALGEAKLSAGQSGNSILKGETEKEKEEFGRPLTVAEKTVQRGDALSKTADRLKAYMPASVGGTLMDMAFDGMNAGLGQGDGLSTFKGGLSSMGSTFESQKGEISQEINAEASEYGRKVNNLNPFKKPDYESRAAGAENVYRQAVVGGKRDTTDADNAALSANLAAIASGSASNEQMLSVMQAQNTMKLSKEQQQEISNVRNNSEVFDNFSSQETAANQALMERVQKEFASKKGISNDTMSELSARTSAGMMDYGSLQNLEVQQGKTGPRTSLGNALSALTTKDIGEALRPMVDKVDAGQKLSIPEQQMATRMFDQQQNSLVGQTSMINNFDKVLSGTRQTEYLKQSRDESSMVIEETLRNMESALSQGKLSSEVAGDFELSLGSKNQKGLIRSTGEVDGFYLGGQAITSPSDLNNLNPQNRKLFEDFYKSLDMAMNDKETNNMVSQKVSELRLNSDNLQKLYLIGKKIKGDGV
jgi:hypothetical protein